MAFTLTCHVCSHKIKLFDSAVKKRKGTVRCVHCGARIAYDLDNRKIQQSGFWATKEVPFDGRAKKRMMNQIKAPNTKEMPAKTPLENPFQQKSGFAAFDMKTGMIQEHASIKMNAPEVASQKQKDVVSFTTIHPSPKKTLLHTPAQTHSIPRQTIRFAKTMPKSPTQGNHTPQPPKTFWQKIKQFFFGK